MGYKVLYNPALLINEMILFGDTLLNMSKKICKIVCSSHSAVGKHVGLCNFERAG